MTVQEALVDRLKRAMPELRTHSVVAVWIFGSVASDQARDESDVDILADFSRPVSLFQLSRLHRRLEETVGRKVDLVSRDALRRSLWDRIRELGIKSEFAKS
jgi:predicted nucleotidyltransferase